MDKTVAALINKILRTNLTYQSIILSDHIQLDFSGGKFYSLDLIDELLYKNLKGILLDSALYFELKFLSVDFNPQGFSVFIGVEPIINYSNYLDMIPRELQLEIGSYLSKLDNYLLALAEYIDDSILYQFLINKNNPEKVQAIKMMKSIDATLLDINENLYKIAYLNQSISSLGKVFLFKLEFFIRFPNLYPKLIKYTPPALISWMILQGTKPNNDRGNLLQIKSFKEYIESGKMPSNPRDYLIIHYNTRDCNIFTWLYMNDIIEVDSSLLSTVLNCILLIYQELGVRTYLENIRRIYNIDENNIDEKYQKYRNL